MSKRKKPKDRPWTKILNTMTHEELILLKKELPFIDRRARLRLIDGGRKDELKPGPLKTEFKL
jgi:hypothetical protein